MAINLRKLLRDLKHDDPDIRMLSLKTVLQLSKQNVEAMFDLPPVYVALREIAASHDEDTVYMARKGLEHLKDVMRILNVPIPEEPPAVTPGFEGTKEELVAAMRKEPDPVALATLVGQALQFPCEEVLLAAATLTRHKDARVRANAVEVVAAFADEKRATLAFLPLLADENHRVRANAARGLGKVGHPRISQFLLEMARAEREATREAAVWALGHLRGEAHVRVLVQALADPFEPIRLRAIRGLAAHGSRSALPALKSLADDVDPHVAQEAVHATDAIEGRTRPRDPLFDLEAMARADRKDEGEKQSGDELTESNRKKAQEELARIEKILAGEAPRIPRAELEGKALEELAFIRDQHLVYIGQSLSGLCRSGQVTHLELTKQFYDLLRCQELLGRRREIARAQGEPSGSWFRNLARDAAKGMEEVSGSWFSAVKSKLGATGSEDPIAKLEQRINAILLEMGRIGVPLLERGEARIQGQEELLRRLQAIGAAMETAKGGTGPNP